MSKSAGALLTIALILVSAIGTPRAQATISSLTLSTHSSDGFPDYTDAEYLDATLDFEVVDSLLTLTVTNTTDGNPADYQFSIIEVYFNYDASVTGLTWNGAATNGWALEVNPDNIHVDLFGYYDVRLYIDPPPNKDIDPGDFETFAFIIGGSGSAEDFTTFLSAPNGLDTVGLAAAKFDSGGPKPGNAWAYGMVVPEPATLALLGLGSLLLLSRKRRA